MKTNKTFSISFHQRVDKIDKSGQAPIYLRVTVDGERAEIATNRRFDVSRWENGRPTGNKTDAKLFQKYLDSLKARVYEIQRDLIDRKETITAEIIKNQFIGRDVSSKTLVEVFKLHNQQLRNLIGVDYSPATAKRYDTTLSHVIKYMKYQYKKDDMLLTELNYEFVSGLEYFLKTVNKCNHNSTMKYIKNFRKVINLSVKNEWLEKDPFAKFECKIKPVERPFLTSEELSTMENRKFSNLRLEQVRDVFVFCCYTGLAFIDVEKLNANHIVTGIDGAKWININRTKTETKSLIPLLPKAIEIIDKYSGTANTSGRLLPVITNQKINAYLKEIADLCGITKNLTFHIARHTFATTVTLTNGVSIETVSAMLGHKDLRTTQIYAKVVEQKIGSEMAKLKEKLKMDHTCSID